MKVNLQAEKLSKYFSVFLLLFGVATLSYAQRTELGFGIGGLNYTGDLVRNYNFKFIKPAATGLFRANLNKALSFRASIVAGQLGADDTTQPIDRFAVSRDSSFTANGSSSAFDIFLFEASAVMEYHFLDWRSEKSMIRWTPYLFAGFAVFGVSGQGEKPVEYSDIQPAIPFGVGIKYILNPKWYLGVEFGARKIFFDHLDNISDGNQGIKNFQYGNPNDDDAYYFLGITLTHSFYTIPCPTSPYR